MTGGLLGLALLATIFFIWEKKNAPAVLWFSAVILTSGLFLTFSRSASIAAVASCCVLIFLLMKSSRMKKGNEIKKDRSTRQKMREKLIATIIALALPIVFWTLLVPGLITTRLQGSERLEARSLQERVSDYQDFFKIFSSHWAEGTGIGAYTLALHQLDGTRNSYDYQPIHNTYLLIAAELGIFGLLIFLTLFLSLLRRSYQHAPLFFSLGIFFLVSGFFDHYWWTSYWGISVWWVLWMIPLQE